MTHGLVLGKFLPYHAGHAHLITEARRQVDRLTVLVCSIAAEPIEGRLRHGWVFRSHRDCRVLHVDEELPQAPADAPDFWPIWTEVVARHAGRVDTVFTSEPYGGELARRLGARHVAVDPERRVVPVSGLAVRADPMGLWRFIPAEVRPHYLRRVAILGAESTGKTTLSRRLADALDTAWVPEFGRLYCEHRDALALRPHDFEAIAWGQDGWEAEAARRAERVLVCDTELHTTNTWSDMVTGSRPDWMTVAARDRRYDLVLVLENDVPWEHDGTRVLENRREEHLARIEEELRAAGRSWVRIGGDADARFRHALALVARLAER
ncbi:MAG: AAA family ATPase [Gemmatimonadetes bacterium]|nr:AAA family ATPase [Gemmatimonadota bacterium]